MPGLWHEGGTLRRQVALLHWLVRGEGESSDPVRVWRVRLLDRPLVRQVPELRRLRHARRGVDRSRERRRRGAEAAPAPRGRAGRGRRAHLDRRRRARPRARRRSRPRVARARRRRARRGEVDAAARRAGPRLAHTPRPARHRRGVRSAGEAPRRADGRHRARRDPGRHRPRRDHRDARAGAARRLRHRLGADALLRGDRLGTRLGRRRSARRRPASCASRRSRASRCSSSAT